MILICVLMLAAFSNTYAQTGSPDEISITIPRNVIINFIKAALPLNLENGPYLKGDVWIQAIDQVKITSNRVEFEMMIQGKDLKVETHLGKKVMFFDIGNLNAAFSCDASIRYDASKRLLYFTPNILQKPNGKDGNDADQFSAILLQMLALANGTEYPVEIQEIQPFVTKIAEDYFNIDINITNISTGKDTVLIRGLPKFKKTTD